MFYIAFFNGKLLIGVTEQLQFFFIFYFLLLSSQQTAPHCVWNSCFPFGNPTLKGWGAHIYMDKGIMLILFHVHFVMCDDESTIYTGDNFDNLSVKLKT